MAAAARAATAEDDGEDDARAQIAGLQKQQKASTTTRSSWADV